MLRVVCILAALLAIVIGYTFQDDPWRLGQIGYPSDQVALAHQDSVYSHVTWAISKGDNSAELRFFDKVEGGVCLVPSWDELAGYGLTHLAMPAGYDTQAFPPGPTWPAGEPKPNPGTLTHTRYITLYPTAILLNDRLLAEAGGEWIATKPDILIVGLGSGVGAALYAHHFPQCSITVVDIDPVVNDMVRKHYPLLRWLETQQTADGRPRLQLIARDARQYVIATERRYDVIVLDAYTSGSTIPPHLMTREFYAECAAIMPPDGIMLSNIIGSYTGPQRLVLGGAIRSMRAAGLPEVLNFPIVFSNEQQAFEKSQNLPRNNIVLASRQPLDPRQAPQAWARLRDFVDTSRLYAAFPTRRYTGSMIKLLANRSTVSSEFALHRYAAEVPELAELMRELDRYYADKNPSDGQIYLPHTEPVVDKLLAAIATHVKPTPQSWRRAPPRPYGILYSKIDYVRAARDYLANSIAVAGSPQGTIFPHAGERLVGPIEDSQRSVATPWWLIAEAPLFTDGTPNADIYNH